jgi:hypothetical protein
MMLLCYRAAVKREIISGNKEDNKESNKTDYGKQHTQSNEKQERK